MKMKKTDRRVAGLSNSILGTAIIIFLMIAAALVTWKIVTSPGFALARANKALASGDAAGAATRFRRAIDNYPNFVEAWVGLLAAEPSPENCRNFASEFPEFFDEWQPAAELAYFIPAASADAAGFQPVRSLFDSFTGNDADDSERIIVLDLEGRKELAQAWRQLDLIREEVAQKLKEPFLPHQRRVFVNHDFEAARALIANSVQRFLSPKDWLDAISKVEAAARAGDSGLRKLNSVVAEAPDYVPSALTLIYVDISRGRTEDAKSKIGRALRALGPRRRGSAEMRLRYALARVHEMEGNIDLAASELEKALQFSPHNVGILLRVASIHVRAGRIDAALAITDAVSEKREFDDRASYVKGMACRRLGRNEMAVALFSAGLRNLDYDAAAHYELALARLDTGQPLLASIEFLRYSAKTGDTGWPLAAASACALAAGYGKEAGEAASSVLADVEVIKEIPELKTYARRFSIAAQIIEGGRAFQGLSIEPLMEGGDRELNNYLIAGLWAAQAYVAAESDIPVSPEKLEYFARRASHEPSAKYALAFLLLASGEIEQGKAMMEELVELQPDYPLAALHLARLYLLEGKTERAARVMKAAKSLSREPAAEKVFAIIDELQGVKAPADDFARLPMSDKASGASVTAPYRDDVRLVGPHLVLFTAAVHADHRSYMKKVLLLDPVSDFGDDVLRMAYNSIRSDGLGGLSSAAASNPRTDLFIRSGLAIYETNERQLYDLVIGRFWKEIPQKLSR